MGNRFPPLIKQPPPNSKTHWRESNRNHPCPFKPILNLGEGFEANALRAQQEQEQKQEQELEHEQEQEEKREHQQEQQQKQEWE